MSWFWTAVASIVCGVLGGACGLFIATLCVDWYNIPSREGESGYYTIYIGLGAMVFGLIAGAIASRVVAALHHGAGWQQVGSGLALVLVTALCALSLARVRADVAPTLDGKRLDVDLEVRGPEGQIEPPEWNAEEAWISIGSIDRSSRVLRTERSGSFAGDGPHVIDGRWVISATVPLFTERGERVVRFKAGAIQEGFQLGIPARPGKDFCEWSGWLPRARSDGGPAVNTTMYRFRLVERE